MMNGQLLRRAFAILVVATSCAVAIPLADSVAQGGNSEDARACQQDGWASLARAENPGIAFTDQSECVSYAAEGGQLVAYAPPTPTPEPSTYTYTLTIEPLDSTERSCAVIITASGYAPGAMVHLYGEEWVGEWYNGVITDVFPYEANADGIAVMETWVVNDAYYPDDDYSYVFRVGDWYWGRDNVSC